MYLRAAGGLGAVAGRGLAAVGGVDELVVGLVGDGGDGHVEGLGEGACGAVGEGRVEALGQIVLVFIAAEHLLPVAGRGLVAAGVRAHDHEQPVFAVGLHDVGVVVLAAAHVRVGAGVGDAGRAACLDHGLDLLFVGLPVCEEHAWRAGHGQQVGVGGERVLRDGVLGGVRAALGVVVLHEGHGPLAVAALLVVLAHQRPAAVVLLGQQAPVALVDGVAHGVAELEVEGGRGLARAVDPAADGVRAVPALAHGELGLCRLVVHLRVLRCVALHHVVAESRVAQVVQQHVEVCLYVRLHVLALVVEVAHAVPALAGVVVRARLMAVSGGLVVGDDVLIGQLVGHPVVGLLGEVCPRADVAPVVDHHVGDGADAPVLEGLDQLAQLGLGAERAVVVLKPVQVVVSHRLAAAVAALWQPHEVERAADVVGLLLEGGPLRVVVRVPVESLQHHAGVVGGPPLCVHGGGGEGGDEQGRQPAGD